MTQRRVIALGLLVAGAVLVAFVLVRGNGDDQSLVVGRMSDLATTPRDDFPAIVDSAVRDPEARIAPVAATYAIVETIDHDPAAFTQGLELDAQVLFESTGLFGGSTLREVDPASGLTTRSVALDESHFGEGLTIVDDEIVQLTWQAGIAYRWSRDTFEPLAPFTYDGEGWGLCHDGSDFFMSDGSSTITTRRTADFAPTGVATITFNGAPVEQLNELECVVADGSTTVWANIWKSPLLIEIDPASGDVLTVVDARDLRPDSTLDDDDAVLNGIAFDAESDTFLVTGKRWPVMYRIRIEVP